ncbi:MAG: hypothetical protein ABFR75_07000 [Acidobacteriota bacterium]
MNFKTVSIFFFPIFVLLLFNPGCSNSLSDPGLTEDQSDKNIFNNPKNRTINDIMSKNLYLRIYKWKNMGNKIISTRFFIRSDNLKNDDKNFGISKKMKHPSYLKKRGFKKIGENIIIDYKEIFKRSLKYFFSHSRRLLKSLKYSDSKDPLNDFLRFVQYIKYKIPPKYIKGKYTGEFFTPLQSLYYGYGDCDTKSILLADLLSGIRSKEKLGIVIMRGYGIFHAILVIKRNPLPGMKALFFPGKGYFIPLETTIKNWMPGFLDKRAVNCLKSGYYRFDPLN